MSLFLFAVTAAAVAAASDSPKRGPKFTSIGVYVPPPPARAPSLPPRAGPGPPGPTTNVSRIVMADHRTSPLDVAIATGGAELDVRATVTVWRWKAPARKKWELKWRWENRVREAMAKAGRGERSAFPSACVEVRFVGETSEGGVPVTSAEDTGACFLDGELPDLVVARSGGTRTLRLEMEAPSNAILRIRVLAQVRTVST